MKREFIAEDFAASMFDLGKILESTSRNGAIPDGIVEDARIHCFRRAVIHFEEYLEHIVDDVEIELDEAEVINKRMFFILHAFLDMGVLTTEQFDMFGKLFASSVILSIEREKLSSKEELEFYNESVKCIPAYFQQMDEFVGALMDFACDEEACHEACEEGTHDAQ